MSKYKDIINSYKEANVSSTELYNGVMSLHNIFDYVEKQDNKIFWKSMRKLHESIKGAHFDEEYAKWQVSTMYHTADNGKICKGEIYNYDCAKNVFDKYVRNINSSITVWDVYVAINAQYHDYIRLYSEWFRNINKNELDNKIIESAITFYFKDEDSGSTKTWNYFKTANWVYIRFVVAAICISKHVAAFVVYIPNVKNLLLFFVLFQLILYLLAVIILKCIII